MEDIRLRDADAHDVPFLQAMLYEAANKPGEQWLPFDECINLDRNRRFWEGWPRPDDVGVIAESQGRPVGAAWIRTFRTAERLSPFDEDGVPELAIAVIDAYRGRRIGHALLGHLIQIGAERGISSINLSTGTFNTAAVRLYERHSFRETARRGEAVRMKWTAPEQDQ